jgi:IS30 family transposase
LMLMDGLPFTPRMRLDRQQVMWDAWCSGLEMDVVAGLVGVCRKTVFNRVRETGGIRPRRRQTRARLSYEDRVHIEIGLKQNRSIRSIAGDLGRHASTISREISRHLNPVGRYVAKTAHAAAFAAAEAAGVQDRCQCGAAGQGAERPAG